MQPKHQRHEGSGSIKGIPSAGRARHLTHVVSVAVIVAIVVVVDVGGGGAFATGVHTLVPEWVRSYKWQRHGLQAAPKVKTRGSMEDNTFTL